jgi:hypothetical protein
MREVPVFEDEVSFWLKRSRSNPRMLGWPYVSIVPVVADLHTKPNRQGDFPNPSVGFVPPDCRGEA